MLIAVSSTYWYLVRFTSVIGGISCEHMPIIHTCRHDRTTGVEYKGTRRSDELEISATLDVSDVTAFSKLSRMYSMLQ